MTRQSILPREIEIRCSSELLEQFLKFSRDSVLEGKLIRLSDIDFTITVL